MAVVVTLNHRALTITEGDTEEAEEEVVVEGTEEESGTRLEEPTAETIGTAEIEVVVVVVAGGIVEVIAGEVEVEVATAEDLMELLCPPTIGGKRMDLVTGTTAVEVEAMVGGVVEEEEETTEEVVEVVH